MRTLDPKREKEDEAAGKPCKWFCPQEEFRDAASAKGNRLSKTPGFCYKLLMQANFSNLFTVTLFLLALAASSAATNTIVVPRGLANSFGTSWSYPFSGLRESFEQIYGSTAFTEVADQTLIITEIAFRVDESDPDDLDGFMLNLLLRMNTFKGTLAEIMERGSGAQIPLTRVFFGERVRLSSRPGAPEGFNIQFRLERPFVYSPHEGQLVLIVSHEGGRGPTMDADDPYDEGFSITREPFTGTPEFGPSMLVTKFSYLSPPEIEAIRSGPNSIEIDFTYTGGSDGIQVEFAPSVGGSYTPIANIELAPVSPQLTRAVIPLPPVSTFYRLRLWDGSN